MHSSYYIDVPHQRTPFWLNIHKTMIFAQVGDHTPLVVRCIIPYFYPISDPVGPILAIIRSLLPNQQVISEFGDTNVF
jgi:hypothetical protein